MAYGKELIQRHITFQKYHKDLVVWYNTSVWDVDGQPDWELRLDHNEWDVDGDVIKRVYKETFLHYNGTGLLRDLCKVYYDEDDGSPMKVLSAMAACDASYLKDLWCQRLKDEVQGGAEGDSDDTEYVEAQEAWGDFRHVLQIFSRMCEFVPFSVRDIGSGDGDSDTDDGDSDAGSQTAASTMISWSEGIERLSDVRDDGYTVTKLSDDAYEKLWNRWKIVFREFLGGEVFEPNSPYLFALQ